MSQVDEDDMVSSKNELSEDDDDDTFSGIGDSFEYDTADGSDEDYNMDPPAETAKLRTISSIYVGQEFQSKEDMQFKLTMLKLEENFDFRVDKSESSLVVVKCAADRSCKWMKPWKSDSKIYQPTVLNERGEDGHNSKPDDIRNMMFIKHGVDLMYLDSWKSLEHVKESVRGPAESGYKRLPAYIHMIKRYNPGTVAHIEKDGKDRFKYLFLSFGACLKGFKFMRKVIVVDGSFLKGKYGGLLLVATAQDDV